jgi:hypothetical protein
MGLFAGRRRQHRADRYYQIDWVHEKHPLLPSRYIAQTETAPARRSFKLAEKLLPLVPPAQHHEYLGKSEVDPEYQPGLVPLEIDKIEGCRRSGGPPPCLNAPRDRQPGAFRQLQVGGWPGKQRLSG